MTNYKKTSHHQNLKSHHQNLKSHHQNLKSHHQSLKMIRSSLLGCYYYLRKFLDPNFPHHKNSIGNHQSKRNAPYYGLQALKYIKFSNSAKFK